MDELTRRSPLYSYGNQVDSARIEGNGVLLLEKPFTGLVRVQLSHVAAPEAEEQLAGVIGCELPQGPESVSIGEVTVIWQSLRDWLIVTHPGDEDALSYRLEESGAVVNVVTDAKVDLRLEGRHARDLLAVGCGIDLHPSAFQNGSVVSTLIGKVRVLLRKTETRNQFQILVDRSYAAFLWDWMSKVSQEF